MWAVRMGQGRHWAKTENIRACKAFVRASENSVTGNGMKMKTFAHLVGREYEALLTGSDNGTQEMYKQPIRPGAAIVARFKAIRRSCLEFERCYQQVVGKKLTGGPTDADIIYVATAVHNDHDNLKNVYSFMGEDKNSAGAEFPFLNCYMWLRSTHLWKNILQSVRKAPMNESLTQGVHQGAGSPQSDDDVVTATNESPPPPASGAIAISSDDNVDDGTTSSKSRPVGTKRTAEKLRMTAALDKSAIALNGILEQSAKKAKIAEDMVAAQRERTEVEKLREHRELFATPGVPEDIRKEYLRMRAQQALRMLQAQESTKLNNAINTSLMKSTDTGEAQKTPMPTPQSEVNNTVSPVDRTDPDGLSTAGRHKIADDVDSPSPGPIVRHELSDLEDIDNDSACVGNLAERYVPTMDFTLQEADSLTNGSQSNVRNVYQIID